MKSVKIEIILDEHDLALLEEALPDVGSLSGEFALNAIAYAMMMRGLRDRRAMVEGWR